MLFCNPGEVILKKKFETSVEAINSGIVDETKAICNSVITNHFQWIIMHLNFSIDGAMVD